MSMQPIGKDSLVLQTTNLLTLIVPAVKFKGLSAASAAVVRLIFLSHTMPRYLNASV